MATIPGIGRITASAIAAAVPDASGRGHRPSETEPFWKAFLRSLADRGLRGVKLVIADDHKGLRAAASKVFSATRQRCRVHWMRNAFAHAAPKQRPAVIAMIKTIFQNAERAGDPIFEPMAANRKGAASARAVDLGQIELFPEHRIEKEQTVAELNANVWILFVEAQGQNVRAEFSRPKAISDEQYAGFHERILLVQGSEWDTPDPLSDDGEPPADFEVTVSRKG